MEPVTQNRGVINGTKAADLRDETFDEFSSTPFDFEDTTLMLWEDTQKAYYLACTANRFSEKYLQICPQLEKNIRELGSFCLTKAVLEQKGTELPKLAGLTVRELVCMVSFHLRKAHAALDGVYKDNNILALSYLNWEFRWVGLGNRLKATEVKIQQIKEGKLSVDDMLQQAETFKNREGSNTASQTPQSLRANPNALPVKGSMAREMLKAEKAEAKKAEEIRKEKERLLKLANRYERRIPGGINPPRPFGPTKEDMAMINRANAAYYRKQAEALDAPRPEPEPELLPPGALSEAEAREQLMEDAKKRNDQDALRAIPQENTDELHERWLKYVARVERKSITARNGPSPETRKALREKRKKRK